MIVGVRELNRSGDHIIQNKSLTFNLFSLGHPTRSAMYSPFLYIFGGCVWIHFLGINQHSLIENQKCSTWHDRRSDWVLYLILAVPIHVETEEKLRYLNRSPESIIIDHRRSGRQRTPTASVFLKRKFVLLNRSCCFTATADNLSGRPEN